jgi:aliphatic aldoxime dehydratase
MSRPAGWQPPYPAFWPKFAADRKVVFAYFGVQGSDEAARVEFAEWLAAAFAADYAPGHGERGYFIDTQGERNDVWVGYWLDAGDYHRWRESGVVTQFWDSPQRLTAPAGYWNETLILPSQCFEALFSSAHMAGAARLASSIGEPVAEHAYWGAARDRIPALSRNDSPKAAAANVTRAITTGQRVRLKPPANLCLIHTAQNWAHCPDAQRTFYLEEVRPTLEQGLGYLATHVAETGCLAARYVQELETDGLDAARTHAMCYFRTFRHLEDWAREHPTHLRIYGSFMRLAQQFDFDVKLRLWHQVAVLPPDNPHFEYLNCHQQTGLLPHFT